jgi:hypothetical protein
MGWIGTNEVKPPLDWSLGRGSHSGPTHWQADRQPPTARSEVRMLTRFAPRGSVQLCRSCSRAVMMVTVTAAHGQDRSYKEDTCL